MKKRTALFLLLIITCMMLSACGHEHVWQAATCTSPKMCPDCGESEGEALGHNWSEATCTEPKYCTICLQTISEALGHNWKDATCEESKTCMTCDTTEGTALGHNWNPATCTDPEICSVCAASQGEAKGHSIDEWNVVSDSTCTEAGIKAGTCSVCGENIECELALKEHTPSDWQVTVQPTVDADGTHVKVCTVCNTELESETFSLSEEEIEKLYKSNCKTISYDKLSRTPGDYEGEYVKFTGKVLQVCSEAESILYYSTYRVATSGGYNNVVYILVDNYGSGTRILEDDWITFYGEFKGLYTYTTVMGASVTIPKIEVVYID